METTPFWIEGIGAAVGAIAAAVGAGAAWRAAKSSSSAASDARDALALVVMPNVDVVISQWGGEGSALTARASAVSRPWDERAATDVLLQFQLSSGRAGSRGPARLDAVDRHAGRYEPPFVELEITTPTDKWPPPDGDHVDIRAEFSDVRRAARYLRTFSADLHQSDSPGLVSVRNLSSTAPERIG